MKIAYELAPDDVVSYNLHHHAHAPASRRMFAMAHLFGTVVLLAPSWVAFTWLGSRVLGALALLVPVAYLLLAPRLTRQVLTRQVRASCARGARPGLLGRHELELTPTHLVERTDATEMRLRLETLGPVTSTGAYSFVGIGPSSALVIPHAAVVAGSPDSFVAALRKAIAARGEPEPAPAAGQR